MIQTSETDDPIIGRPGGDNEGDNNSKKDDNNERGPRVVTNIKFYI